ncbi:mutator type transposase [Tanacetum coccineum]
MAPPQIWYILPEGESFDIDVYGDFPKSLILHGFSKKEYVDGEFCFVDMLDIDDFKVDILNSVMCSIGYEDDDELLLYYKIPLKSLDVRLKQVVSETGISNKNFKEYVKNHKIMYFYLELVEKTNSSSDEDGQSDSESEDANDLVDNEHLVEEVEVNMNSFNFQLNGEDETDFIDPIQPHVNLTEDDLLVLDFDSLESDQEDVPENARSGGLRKLRKKHMSSGIRNNFYIGKEFANRVLAKERIRAYAVETRRNLDFKVNDKRRIRVICNGVVLTLNSIIEYVDKIQGPNQDISKKGKGIMQDAKEDKMSCPWLLYLSKGDKSKWKRIMKNQAECSGIYVCLGALKRGFKESGKELLGLDGAFMRGQYYGQMLTAVGVDANNGIYLVAYGIVESENQYSWTWFLTCLADDFDLYTNSDFTFIIDRQNGLVPTIAKIFPAAEHRYLLDARDSPIITSLEYVREYLMKGIVIVQKIIQKSDGPLTPSVTKLFNKIKEAASECTVDWNGIPCKHAIAAIHDMADNGMDVGTPEDWVHESYKLQTWMNVYAHKINPINVRDVWSKFKCPTTLLPLKKAQRTGRPSKNRKKSKGKIAMVKDHKLTRIEPVRSDTMASQSVTSQHMPTQTRSRGPVTSEHVASQTVRSETMASQSVASQHVASQTRSRGPVASEPMVSQVVGHEIMASHSVAIQTRSRGPVASEHVASQTVARKLVARKPVTRKPIQNKSAANKRVKSQINKPASQASNSSQPASQPSRLPTSPIKRTKMSACRLTPDS